MPLTEHTDPGMSAMRPPPSRPVHFTVKNWVGMASLFAMAVAALFWLLDTKVQPVATDLKHHITVDDKRHDRLEAADRRTIRKVEKLGEAMHRIELRQEATAPRHVRNRADFPPVPDEP